MPHRLGLPANLLEHEVRVRPERERVEIPIEVVHQAILGARVAVEHAVALGRQHGHVAIVEIDHRPGVREDGARVGRHEVFADADTDQERRAAARHDDLVRVGVRDHGETVRPLHARERGDDPLLERVAGRGLDQVGERFGVRLGCEAVARPLELHAQRIGVLDDAVVHERQRAGAVGVWVGIPLGGCAVSRPACVPDAAGAVYRVLGEQVPEGRDAARKFASLHAPAVQHRHASRVIATVFQARQPVQQHRDGVPRPDVSHNTAHRSGPLGMALGRSALEQRLTGDGEAEPGKLRQGAVAHLPQGVPGRLQGGTAPLAGRERRRLGGSPWRPAVPAQRSTACAQHARGLHTVKRPWCDALQV